MDHGNDAHGNGQAIQAALVEGYRQMAADIAREREAGAWTEALVEDAFCVDQEPTL